jgi:hypothetical protein
MQLIYFSGFGADSIIFKTAVIGSWPDYARGPGEAVVLKNPHALMASGMAGVTVYDISHPEQPEIVAQFWTGGDAVNLEIQDDILYVIEQATYSEIDRVQQRPAVLKILDASQPTDMALLSVIPLESDGTQVHIDSSPGFVFIMTEFKGIEIYDTHDPKHPPK